MSDRHIRRNYMDGFACPWLAGYARRRGSVKVTFRWVSPGDLCYRSRSAANHAIRRIPDQPSKKTSPFFSGPREIKACLDDAFICASTTTRAAHAGAQTRQMTTIFHIFIHIYLNMHGTFAIQYMIDPRFFFRKKHA